MDKLKNIVEFIEENNINIKGIVISSNTEKFTHQFSDERVNVYSIAKSITALCVFILKDKKLIDFNDKMMSFFPNMKCSSGTENITIQNLLDMSAGKDTSFFGQMPEDSEDYLQRYLDFDNTLSLDTFRYSNYCSYTLGRIVEVVTGQVLLDFANENIFSKLGIVSPRWSTCNLGHTICAKNLFLNVIELDKIATLIRNSGTVNGFEIISKEHFDKFKDIFKVGTDKLTYSNSFWNIDIEDGYFMKGIYANVLINLPSKGITISMTGYETNNDKRDMLMNFIEKIF